MTPMLSYWCWWLHLGGIAGGMPIAAHTHHHLRAGDHPQPGSKVIKGDSRTSLHPSHEGIICPLSSYSYRRTCRYNLHDLVLPPVKWPHRPPHVHWSTPALEVRVIGSWPKVYQSIVPELYLVSSGLTLGIPLSELPVLATQHLHSNNAELLEGFILDPFAKIKRTKGKGNHLKTLGLFISFNKHKTIAVTGPLIPSRPGVGWCWCKNPEPVPERCGRCCHGDVQLGCDERTKTSGAMTVKAPGTQVDQQVDHWGNAARVSDFWAIRRSISLSLSVGICVWGPWSQVAETSQHAEC